MQRTLSKVGSLEDAWRMIERLEAEHQQMRAQLARVILRSEASAFGVWEIEDISFTYNPPSIAAHDQSGAIVTTVPGLLAGDYCLFVGADPGLPGWLNPTVANPIAVDEELRWWLYNADTIADDDIERTYRFLVIHRSETETE